MKLSVIVPWIDSGSPFRRRSKEWLFKRINTLLPDAELVWGNHLGDQDADVPTLPFNRAAARNTLVDLSHGDVLLIVDADMVLQLDALQSGLQAIASGCPWVILYELGRYYNLSADETARIWACPPENDVAEPTDPARWEHRIDSWAGLLLVPRDAFDKVGGYDQGFDGWGYEDNAFRAALDRQVGHHGRVNSYALHLWHPVREEDTFGQANIAANRALARRYEMGEL